MQFCQFVKEKQKNFKIKNLKNNNNKLKFLKCWRLMNQNNKVQSTKNKKGSSKTYTYPHHEFVF